MKAALACLVLYLFIVAPLVEWFQGGELSDFTIAVMLMLLVGVLYGIAEIKLKKTKEE